MAEPLKYELVLAEKLQALPVPDLADQIWSRIEKQLDIDMPSDDGPGDGGGGSPILPRLSWTAAIFLIALITYFVSTRNRFTAAPNPNPSLNNTNIQLPQPTDRREPTEIFSGKKVNAGNAPPRSNNNVFDSLSKPASFSGDSNAVLPPALSDQINPQNSKADSSALVITPPKATDTTPSKKKRGVSGITDGDYRIVPKNKE